MNNIINKNVILIVYAVLYFILGVLLGQNVIYLFKFGNTYINIIHVFAIIFLFLYLINFNRSLIKHIYKLIFGPFSLIIIAILFSLISSGIATIHYNDQNYISTSVKGIFYFGLIIFVFISIMVACKNKAFIYGVFTSYIINVVFAIIQFIFFENGRALSLYPFFPQPFYYVSMSWDLIVSGVYYGCNAITFYRASGFFLECSHFAIFLTVSFIYLFINLKNKERYVLILVSIPALYLLILSRTGNLLIYILTILLCIIIYLIKNKSSKSVLSVLLFFIILSFAILITFTLDLQILIKIRESLSDSNLFSDSNSERLLSMKSSIDAWIQNPFGIGYNNASKYLQKYYQTLGTYNYFLTFLLECGLFGLVLLILFYSILFIKLARQKKKYSILLLFVIFLFQIGNGTNLTPIILLGFAFVIKGIEKDDKTLCFKNKY